MTVTLCYVLHLTHWELWHIQYTRFQVHTRRINHVHCNWGIFTHILTLLRHIQAYSGIFRPCVTLAYSPPSHILDPGIFRTGSLLQTLWKVDLACSETCHRNYSASKSWNIQNSSITASREIFRTLSYLRKFTNIQNSDMFNARHIFRTLAKI